MTEIKFDHKYLFLYENKHQYVCDIFVNEKEVGVCKYYRDDLDIDDATYIEFILIYQQFRRKGYATEMVKDLQSKFNLKWDGQFTNMGRIFYESLIKKLIIKR